MCEEGNELIRVIVETRILSDKPGRTDEEEKRE